MHQQYWDRVAPVYRQEVHDSLASDRTGVLRDRLDRLRSPTQAVVDFGSGVGRYLGALSGRFKLVYALDHSQKCLDLAAAGHRHLRNVIYRRADLTRPLIDWKPQRIGVCMNVLIAPSYETRAAMLNTMHAALAPRGTLLLLVPSLESALYVDTRLVEWNMRDGLSHRRAMRKTVRDEPGMIGHAVAGLVDRGGEPTKHYLREEAIVHVRSAGFGVEDVERVEYPWAEEFHHPPRWLGDPYPWHWLLACRRK